MLHTVGYFTETPEQEAFLKQFEQTSNPVLVFCEDQEFVGVETRENIYYWYTQWCASTGHKPLSREKFLPKFRDCMGERIVAEKQKRVNGKVSRVFEFSQ